jgi:four helix bundle protein
MSRELIACRSSFAACFAPRSSFVGRAPVQLLKARLFDSNRGMVVNRFEDLDAWQVADELRQEVYALTATGPASQDFKFCNQIRDAASSATRNISEGFGRFHPKDFAHFMDFSIGSVMEIQDCLRDGVLRQHFTDDMVRKAQSLTVRSASVQGSEALSPIGTATSTTNAERPTNAERAQVEANDERRPIIIIMIS